MLLLIGDPRAIAAAAIAESLVAAGHQIVGQRCVRDEVAQVRGHVLDAVESGEVEVLVVVGRTGIAPRDVTPDAVVPLFGRRIPGFGELYRQLAAAEEGPTAALSRAEAGIITRTLVFLVPGGAAAYHRALAQIIVPLLPRAVTELRRSRAPG